MLRAAPRVPVLTLQGVQVDRRQPRITVVLKVNFRKKQKLIGFLNAIAEKLLHIKIIIIQLY
jgi:hypothetical protein